MQILQFNLIMQKILLILISTIFYCANILGQCTITVPSKNGYTVTVTLKAKNIVATTPCQYGFNYNVNIDYSVAITGIIPGNASLHTLQGTLGCGNLSHFFDLPNTAATGTVLSQSNVWNSSPNCATASVASLNCNTFTLEIQGPGISRRFISCNSVPVCVAGANAPTLSATTKNILCPATATNLTTITASNKPANAVFEWHSATPVTAANKVLAPSLASAGTYYAVFFDALNNCYSPTTTVTVSTTPCCNSGNVAPNLSNTNLSNVCPLSVANLGTITANNIPSGTFLEWHTAIPANLNNRITALNVGSGTYYAVFFDVVNNCYSPASPIIVTTTSCSGTGVSSGNDGGLESDGCLAGAIAHRNFQRTKAPSVSSDGKHSLYDNPSELAEFVQPKKGSLNTRGDMELESFIPQNPFGNITTSYVTSPKDLLGITNAKKVVSVDYFDNNTKQRLAAVLSTKTQGKVYDHTKVICDRLVGSQLLSTERIEIDGKPFILALLQRENGVLEYNINFSVNKENATTAMVTSQWAIETYLPKPDYWNFQVWAASSDDAKKLTLEILNKFKEQYATVINKIEPSIPKVFVKKGRYDNGILNLNIQNTNGATQITLLGNFTSSETHKQGSINKTIALSGAVEENIAVQVGSIFDIGFNLKNNKTTEYDALYFADGTWGLDYDKNLTKVDYFDVDGAFSLTQNDAFTLERNPSVRGITKDYVSLFRTLRPASIEADMSSFNNLSFTAWGSNIVEVTLVKKSITQWSKQYRSEIRLDADRQAFNLSLKDFSNGTNEPIKADDLVSVVFTTKSDGKTEKSYEMSVENLVLNNYVSTEKSVAEGNMSVFPNPASETAMLALNVAERGKAQINVTNLQGLQVRSFQVELAKGNNRISIPVLDLPAGIYVVSAITSKGKMSSKVLVNQE
jgi:Secretion system C-terminal sorting domain